MIDSSVEAQHLVDSVHLGVRGAAYRWDRHRQPDVLPRVLCVDEDAASRETLRGLLGAFRCEVDAVADVRDARDAVAASEYGAIVVNLERSVAAGLATTRAIRADEGAAERIPIIGINAYLTESERALCHAAGMNDCIPASLDGEALRSGLAGWLDRIASESDDGGAEREAISAALRDLEAELSPKTVRRICAIFLDDTTSRMQRLSDAMQADDRSAVRAIAHSVKGSFANFRARRAMAAAHALEAAEEATQCREQFVRLGRELLSLQGVVRAYIG